MTSPFDRAQSALLKLEDLIGRLVLVYPSRETTGQSKMNPGKTYDIVIGDTVVCDGEPIRGKIDEVPAVIPDLYWSGGYVTKQLKGNLGTGRPVIGRVVQVKSANYPTPMWQLDSDGLTSNDERLGLRGVEVYEQRKTRNAFDHAGSGTPPF